MNVGGWAHTATWQKWHKHTHTNRQHAQKFFETDNEKKQQSDSSTHHSDKSKNSEHLHCNKPDLHAQSVVQFSALDKICI